MTLVLVGKVLVWGDWTSQIEVTQGGLPHGTIGNPCSMDHPMKTSHDLFGFGLPGTSHYYTYIYIGVSKNRGTQKWMVYNGKPYQNGWFGGYSTTIFGNIHVYVYICNKCKYTYHWYLMWKRCKNHLWRMASTNPQLLANKENPMRRISAGCIL